MPSLIAVGKISKSVGVKGSVKIVPLTADHRRFESMERVLVGADQESAREFSVCQIRISSGSVVVSFQEVVSRTEADALRGQYLFIHQDQLITPPEGSYFVHEIIGMSVMTVNGVHVGSITDVQAFPAQDIWIIRTGKADVMIPAVKEIVKKVDVEKRIIVIDPPEGMIES